MPHSPDVPPNADAAICAILLAIIAFVGGSILYLIYHFL